MVKTAIRQQCRRLSKAWAGAMVISLGLVSASAQLAITEVMSESVMTIQGNPVLNMSDFFEITNFGTNWVDLTGYFFTDASGKQPTDPPGGACFNGVIIGPGESAVFFRSNDALHTLELFTNQWGSCLRTYKIRFYNKPGFNPTGDGVRLYDSLGNLVDSVDFGPATPGVTFVPCPETGIFGCYSRRDDCCTCPATNTVDIGSPGTHSSSLPLRIVAQPVSLTNLCAGLDAVFCISVYGLPRPQYEWQFKPFGQEDWQTIPGANAACVIIPSVEALNEGEYRVLVTNAFASLTNGPATLTVNTNPSPPLLLSQCIDMERFVDEKARFEAKVCALPRPEFQWHSNGVPIPDATNWALVLPSVTLAMSGTVYSVGITNPLGFTNCSVRLLVSPRPQVEITEVMASPSTNGLFCGQADWWELTNTGTNAFNLKGFRHLDNNSLPGAKVVTNDLVLQPGESVIFVEALTRDLFIQSWGEENLPPNLKVVTYYGYGLDEWGEQLHVWSLGAEETTNVLASVSWAAVPPWPWEPQVPQCPCPCPTPLCYHPMAGHSLFFRTNDDCSRRGSCSEAGRKGAIRSPDCDDTGSPGWSPWTPAYWVSIHRESAGVVLSWRAMPGSTNEVQYKSSLDDTNWIVLSNVVAVGASRTISDTTIGDGNHRYYRVVCLHNEAASEVAIAPPPPPPPLVITRSPRLPCGLTLTFTWPTESAYPYILQCRANVADGAWTSLCTNIATTNFLSVTNIIDCDTPQQFYRVISPLVPP